MFDNAHFPRAKKFWHMGRLLDWSETNVHAMSHALHYGTSVFEGIRAYRTPKGPAVFRLEEHLERFFYSASVLNMDVPFDKNEIAGAIKEVIRKNELESAYIRPLLFHAYGNLGLVPRHSPVELVIAAWEWGAYLGYCAETGAHAYILPWRRIHHSQFDMRAKLGGIYVLSTIAGTCARNKGYDEAVFLNLEGNVAEGPGENILIVKDGILITNDRKESILEGITRTSILRIAADMGIPTSIGPISKEAFLQADEAFFSGTAVEIAPITRVTDASDPQRPEEEHRIGTGEAGAVTLKISQAFLKIVSGENPEYDHWLTYVWD